MGPEENRIKHDPRVKSCCFTRGDKDGPYGRTKREKQSEKGVVKGEFSSVERVG